MKLSTKLTIAHLLTAAGSVLTALATEMSGGETVTGHQTLSGDPVDPPTVKRGRKAAAVEQQQPVTGEQQPSETEATAEASTNGAATGKTYEDMRALIEPVIKGGQGAEVKKVIAKYSQTGLKDMDPKHYKAFETDIIALSY